MTCLTCGVAIKETEMYCDTCRPESFYEVVVVPEKGKLEIVFQFVLFSVATFIASMFASGIIVSSLFNLRESMLSFLIAWAIVIGIMNLYFIKGAKLKWLLLLICNIPFLIGFIIILVTY